MTSAVDLLKKFEGCKLRAYRDEGDVWTCGYGCTGPSVDAATEWTQAEADRQLALRLAYVQMDVRHALRVPVTADQFSALSSLAYNIGAHALAKSTLLKKLNAGDVYGAADCFLEWCHVRGAEVPGLLKRRYAERALFMSDEETQPGGPS